MGKPQLYLVAVDGSEWGERAAQKAVALAKQTGAEVRFVTVIPWSGIQPISIEEITARPLEKAGEEARARAEILDPIVAANKDSGVNITTEFHWGHPVDVLRARIKEEKAAMIFVGRRGRSRVADLLLGSVANSLAHTAGIPIVLVP